MTVADLQQFISNLAELVRASKASQFANELDRVRSGLEPFKDKSVGEFADFLAQAERYQRDGILPTTGRVPKAAAAADPTKVQAAIQQVQQLYERAASPDVDYPTIDAQINKLDKLKKDELVAVARGIGIQSPLRTKKAALDEIKRKIKTRKESAQRTEIIENRPL